MKTNLVRAVLACAALLLTSTAALAGGIPISGTPIGLDHDPAGIIAKGTTDAHGNVTFRDLKPGNYIVVIDGKGLIAAVDRLHPPVPEKKSGGGVSLGIGGLFGGGGGHGGDEGHGSHGGGGGGVGLSIPLGHGDPDPDRPEVVQAIANWLYLGLSLPNGGGGIPGNGLSFEIPYCRDGAGQGMRLGFTIPGGAVGPVTIKLGISDQASSGNLTSY